MKKELKPINDIYEQYKHLDPLFSDIEWLKNDDEGGISPMRQALYDFWEAIKREVTRPQRQELSEEALYKFIDENFTIYMAFPNFKGELAKAICSHFSPQGPTSKDVGNDEVYLSNGTDKKMYIKQYKERLPMPKDIDLSPNQATVKIPSVEEINKMFMDEPDTYYLIGRLVDDKFSFDKYFQKLAQAIHSTLKPYEVKVPPKKSYGYQEINMEIKDIHGISHGITWSDDEVDKYNQAIDDIIKLNGMEK